MIRTFKTALSVALLVLLAIQPSPGADEKAPVSDRQLAAMFFIDYGRSYGYQLMMSRIHLDSVRAELERDQELLRQREELYRKKAIAEIELEIARLKVVWASNQLVVAEKNVDYLAAEYEAMREMVKHFAGVETPVGSLYAIFRRGWDAGCDKGPDEVAAMKAWAEYAEKSLERTRDLNRRRNAPLSAVLEKEAQLKIAKSNYLNRKASLDRCRKTLFPSLEDILAIKR